MTAVSEANGAGEVWPALKPSLATRLPRRPARRAGRSTLVGPDRRQRYAESFLEAKAFTVTLARPEVRDLREQPAPITYLDSGGRTRKHTFDAIVDFHDGTRLALVVKPEALVARQRTDQLVTLLAAELPAEVADGVVLMTERDVGPDALHDAKLLNTARLHPRPDHDAVLRAHLGQRSGSATVADLCRDSGLGGDGFRAVARLIFDGTLTKLSPGRIMPDAVVALAGSRGEAAS